MGILIHADNKIEWQVPFALKMQEGLKQIGIHSDITRSRTRSSDIAILCGTTLWRQVEKSGRYLLVDRASIGDPEYVQLVWDGHGRRGDHCVPEHTGNRWKSVGIRARRWKKKGSRIILCGQTETYSPHYNSLGDWYSKVIPYATHFRGHPAGLNPIRLPRATDWDDAGLAITLNSSVGVDAVLEGIPTVTMDEQAMAWDITSHSPDEVITPDRRPWIRWLAWTQWHHDEIREGEPIKHLFEAI